MIKQERDETEYQTPELVQPHNQNGLRKNSRKNDNVRKRKRRVKYQGRCGWKEQKKQAETEEKHSAKLRPQPDIDKNGRSG